MNADDYKHIEAWGRLLGSYRYFISEEQARAAKEGAPIDAVFKDNDGWVSFSKVTAPDVRLRITTILATMK